MADINDFMRGNGTDALQGETNASLIDDNITNYLQDPLKLLLKDHKRGCNVRYGSAKTVIISAGALVCANSAGDALRMRANTAEVTLTLPVAGASGDSLDTGNAQTSQQYYIYAVADADEDTFTGIISESSNFPTGVTYALKIGSFYNNSSDVVTSVGNIGETGTVITAIGTTDMAPNTTTVSYTDLDDLSIRYVANGAKIIKVTLSAPFRCAGYGTANAKWMRANIQVDSTEKIAGGWYTYSFTHEATCASNQLTVIWVGEVSAGVHTIKAGFKPGGGTMYQEGSTAGARILVVEEM